MSGGAVIVIAIDDPDLAGSLQTDVAAVCGDIAAVEIVSGTDAALDVAAAAHARGHIVPIAFVDLGEGEGVDTVLALHDGALTTTRKVLVTSRATLRDVDRALQRGAVHGMITRPWTRHGLERLVAAHLATFLVEHAPDRLEAFAGLLSADETDRARQRSALPRPGEAPATGTAHRLLDEPPDPELLEREMVRLLDRALGHPPRLRVAPGTILIESGEDVGGIYVVLEGVVQLSSRTESGERILHEDSTGPIVGLLSLASHRRAMLRCRAVTDVRAIPVTIDQLERALEAEPGLYGLLTMVLIGSLARRLRRSDELQVELDESLAALSEARAQLVSAARLATLGELSAGMAHELNNPTAALVRAVEHLADDVATVVGDPVVEAVVAEQLTARPVPTAERRALRRSLTSALGDRRLAERLVDLGVTDPDQARRLAHHDPAALDRLEAAARLGRSIRNATDAAERIRSLVDSLRAYARGEDGRGPVLTDVDVAEGLDNALRLVSHRLDDVDVERDIADDLPPIAARPGALQQVWTNLITNALDAIDDRGHITLRATASVPDRVRVEVIDDGPGIPDQLTNRIFEPRFTTKDGRVRFGLGLGLSISRQVVEEHGGTIRLDSQPGHTVFTVELPVGGAP